MTVLFTQCPWAKLCTHVTSLEPFLAHTVVETNVNNTPGMTPPQRRRAQPGHAHLMGSGSLGACGWHTCIPGWRQHDAPARDLSHSVGVLACHLHTQGHVPASRPSGKSLSPVSPGEASPRTVLEVLETKGTRRDQQSAELTETEELIPSLP